MYLDMQLKSFNIFLTHSNRPGRGALVRRGDFWYPVRVIQKEPSGKWRVRWWRGCKFTSGQDGVEPGELSTVELPDIVDSLWLLQAERRKIRVSFVTRSMEIVAE